MDRDKVFGSNRTDNKRILTRRKCLKTIGAASMALSAVPAASATESTPSRVERALELRESNSWSHSEWFHHLNEWGIQYGYQKKAARAPIPKSNKRISTQIIQGFEKQDLTLTMAYYKFLKDGFYVIEMSWEFSNGPDDAYTGVPEDLVSISYPSGQYNKPDGKDGSSSYGYGEDKYVTNVPDGGRTAGGLAAQYNGGWYDVQNPLIGDGDLGGDLDTSDYMYIYVVPNGSISPSNREITFRYSLLYDSARFGGLSFGSDGSLSFAIKNKQDSWTVSVTYEEGDLKGGQQYTA